MCGVFFKVVNKNVNHSVIKQCNGPNSEQSINNWEHEWPNCFPHWTGTKFISDFSTMTFSFSIYEVFQLFGDSCHKSSFYCIKTGLPGNMIAYLIPIIQVNFNVTEAKKTTHLSCTWGGVFSYAGYTGARKGINLLDVQKKQHQHPALTRLWVQPQRGAASRWQTVTTSSDLDHLTPTTRLGLQYKQRQMTNKYSHFAINIRSCSSDLQGSCHNKHKQSALLEKKEQNILSAETWERDK